MKRLREFIVMCIRFLLEPDYMTPVRDSDAPDWSERHEYD